MSGDAAKIWSVRVGQNSLLMSRMLGRTEADRTKTGLGSPAEPEVVMMYAAWCSSSQRTSAALRRVHVVTSQLHMAVRKKNSIYD